MEQKFYPYFSGKNKKNNSLWMAEKYSSFLDLKIFAYQTSFQEDLGKTILSVPT